MIRGSDQMRDGPDKEGRRQAVKRKKAQEEIQRKRAESRREVEERQHQRREEETPGKMLTDKEWAAAKERQDIREEDSKSCCRMPQEDAIPSGASLDARRQGQEQRQEQGKRQEQKEKRIHLRFPLL